MIKALRRRTGIRGSLPDEGGHQGRNHLSYCFY
jgi:hypothetical protein